MEERWILRRLLIECKRNDQVMVDPEPTAHDPRGLAVRLPCKAKPRLEIFVLSFEKRFDLRIDGFHRVPDIQQVRDLVVRFRGIGRRLPAQSQVQGQPRAHLEVILHVESEHGLADALVALLSDRHSAEKLRLGQDQVLDILKGVLASRFRLDRVVVLDAPDHATPLEVMPVLHVREIIPILPKVVHPESREGGVRSDFADRGGPALLTDGQRSDDLAWDEGEVPGQVSGCYRVLELSRPIKGEPEGIGQSRAASLPGIRFAGGTHGRIPRLAATVGTTAIVVSLRAWRNPSYPPKKKVLSFLIGPPRTPPNWFRRKAGRSALPSPSLSSRSKMVRASNALFRKNSNRVPCNSLVPLRVTAETTAPEARPYSALKVAATILNSLIASTPRFVPADPPGVELDESLTSVPSSKKLFE